MADYKLILVRYICFYIVLFESSWVISILIKESKKDIFFPNKTLQKTISKRNRILLEVGVSLFLIVMFSICMYAEIPRIVNRDYIMRRGQIESAVLVAGEKPEESIEYDITLKMETGNLQIESVYADVLDQGMEVEILCAPKMFLNAVVKINGKTTGYYHEYFRENIIEKIVLVIYVLFYLLSQIWYMWKERKGKHLKRQEKILEVVWTCALVVFCTSILICLADVMDNTLLGSVIAICYMLQQLSFLCFIFSAGVADAVPTNVLETEVKRTVRRGIPEEQLKDFHFAKVARRSPDGTYIFSGKKFYYIQIVRNGKRKTLKETTDQSEIIYYVLDVVILAKAMEYAKTCNEPGSDFRRILFTKELDLFSQCGMDYYYRKRSEIERTLAKSPYVDAKTAL